MPIKPGLKRDSYKTYLRSDHWRDIARRTREYYRFTCVKCRRHVAYGKGDVHHLTYDNIGHEVVGVDTVFLCRNCHIAVTKGQIKLVDTKLAQKKQSKKMYGCGRLWNWKDYHRHVRNNPPYKPLDSIRGTVVGMPVRDHDSSEPVTEPGGHFQE